MPGASPPEVRTAILRIIKTPSGLLRQNRITRAKALFGLYTLLSGVALSDFVQVLVEQHLARLLRLGMKHEQLIV